MADKNRMRSAHFDFWASEEEVAAIRRRMADAGVISLGAYFRKMENDGYHIKLDLSDMRELVALLRRCSNNLNQIVKRANETRSIYEADIEDLRRQYDKLWEVANGILEGLAKIKQRVFMAREAEVKFRFSVYIESCIYRQSVLY